MDNKNINQLALKAGTFYVIAQFFIRGISFLATPIYTRLLSTAQYGTAKIYESWLLIMIPIVSMGLYRSVEVAKYDHKDHFVGYVANIIKLGLLQCLVFAALCLIFQKQICSLLDFTPWMLYIMLFYIFADFTIKCYQNREKQLMRYRNSVIFTLITVPAATILSICLLVYGHLHNQTDRMLLYRIAGYYIPLIIGGIFLAMVMIRDGKCKIQTSDWRYGLKFSIPLISELLSIQIMNQIDKIMIQRMVGSSEAGIYSLATTVSYIIWIVEDAVWGAWLPWLYTKIEQHEESDARSPWILMMHIFGIVSLFLSAIVPELVWIMGGSSYHLAVYIAPSLIMSTLFRFFSYSFSAIQNYEKKTTFVAVGTIVAMVINVITNYIGIRIWGYIAAAYATALSYFVLLIVQAFLEKKVTGRIVMPLGKTLIISAVYFALCVLLIFTYNFNIFLRYGVMVLAALVLLVLSRKKLMGLLSQLKQRS